MAARRPPAVARVLERVTATVREHDMFEPGDLVMVMLSGGPDSTCRKPNASANVLIAANSSGA